MISYNDDFWKNATNYSVKLLSYKDNVIDELVNELGFMPNEISIIKNNMSNFDFNKSKFSLLKEKGFDYKKNGITITFQSYLILAQEIFTYLYLFKYYPEKKNTIMHFIVDIIYMYNELLEYFNQQGKSFTKCTFTKVYKDSYNL